jgi:hypothetical protein
MALETPEAMGEDQARFLALAEAHGWTRVAPENVNACGHDRTWHETRADCGLRQYAFDGRLVQWIRDGHLVHGWWNRGGYMVLGTDAESLRAALTVAR